MPKTIRTRPATAADYFAQMNRKRDEALRAGDLRYVAQMERAMTNMVATIDAGLLAA